MLPSNLVPRAFPIEIFNGKYPGNEVGYQVVLLNTADLLCPNISMNHPG